ncbi:MAG TPA: hypothetical protein VNA44_02020 [Burkholderiaceae bacterium]|nr:hypothetical protein [Burkholderiaceae bacterium]
MKRTSQFTPTHDLMPINDLLHAAVMGGALMISLLGLADELFSLRTERVFALAAYFAVVASITCATVLAQPSLAAVRAAMRRRRAELATT